MEPIRVLHIVMYMGHGGAETMIMNYYRNIDREKLQFDFLVHRDFEGAYDKEILALGGKILRIPRMNPFSKRYRHELNDFFKNHSEYKIVHSHIDCMSSLPLFYAKRHNVPIRIAHSHNSNQDRDIKYPLRLFYKNKLTKTSNIFFACGKKAGDWMFDGKPYILLPNAIDSILFSYNETIRSDMRKELAIDNSLVIGHVGRFNKQKNHEYLVDIFNCFYQRHKNSKLLLVGDGPCKDNVLKKAKYYNIENAICFLGQRNDINKVLQAMDIFVFPSLFEGTPLTVIEAQAAGLPCLISDKVPIDCKKTDLVYQIKLSDSPEKWADKIEELLKIKRRNTYDEIKKSGFDVKTNAEKLEIFYLETYKGIKA